MKKILLTGGTGFIGRNLLESSLAEKYELRAPKRLELDLSDEDAVRDFFRKNEFDAVIHSAVKPAHRAAKDKSDIFLANARMFFTIVRNRGSFGKLIHLGSGAAYDMRHYSPKMKESEFDSHVPVDELGMYKYMVGKYSETGPGLLDLRIFGIFGKYEDYSIRFISNMICKALLDLPLTMKRDRLFDYLWVGDLAAILEGFIERDVRHSAYNITPDTSLPLSRIAGMVLSQCGKDLPLCIAETGLGPEYSGDNTRLKQEFPGVKFTAMDEAIRQLVRYYESILNSIDRTVFLKDL